MDSKHDPDTLLLNYQDACIYGRDLDVLEDPHGWLNADMIHFASLRMLNETVSSRSASVSSPPVLILDPSVVSFLMHQLSDEDDLQDFAQGMKHQVRDKKLVLIPVNNVLGTSAWMQPQQGQHWSLLVYHLHHLLHPQENTSHPANDTKSRHILIQCSNNEQYWHIDSIAHSDNLEAAKRVARQWQRIMGAAFPDTNQQAQHPHNAPDPQAWDVEPIPQIPQQRNGYDCGLHVLAAIQAILSMDWTQQPSCCCSVPTRLAQSIREQLEKEPLSDRRRRLAQDVRQLAYKRIGT